MFKNAKILVTGGAGFIGVNLIYRLLAEGFDIRATLHHKDSVIIDDRIEYVRVDLRLEEDCKKVADGVDYVFMCAANTSGAKVMASTPLVHLTPNMLMNIQMLQAAYSAKVKKFLFISTNTVYPLTDFPVKETDVTNNFYESYHIVAWMKRFTEIVCEMYANRIKEPMKTIVVRPGNLYGPYDKFDWEKSKVIPAIIRRAIEKHHPFEVWGDGMDLKDFLYIDDCIDGLILAMENLDEFEPINIASGIPVKIQDVLTQILKSADYDDADVQYDISKPTMIPKRMIDISLAKEKLSFEPKVSLENGIHKTVQWYKEYYKSSSPEDKK
jgi:GDP-L-fucose synthase